MDIKRRFFFSNIGSKTAAVTAGITTPALAHLDSLSDELKVFSKKMKDKVGL